MKPASSAIGAECLWWTNSLVARWTRSIAATATTPNLPAVAMDVARSSVLVCNLFIILYSPSSNLNKVPNISPDFVTAFSNMNIFIRYLYPTRILRRLVTVYSMHNGNRKMLFPFNSVSNNFSVKKKNHYNFKIIAFS